MQQNQCKEMYPHITQTTWGLSEKFGMWVHSKHIARILLQTVPKSRGLKKLKKQEELCWAIKDSAEGNLNKTVYEIGRRVIFPFITCLDLDSWI